MMRIERLELLYALPVPHRDHNLSSKMKSQKPLNLEDQQEGSLKFEITYNAMLLTQK
jgi:hypothetical protein